MFSKSFCKHVEGSVHGKWVEVTLNDEEEREVEKAAGAENAKIFARCLDEARNVIAEKKLKSYQSDVISIAIALFEKQGRHSRYWKENRCREKLDSN